MVLTFHPFYFWLEISPVPITTAIIATTTIPKPISARLNYWGPNICSVAVSAVGPRTIARDNPKPIIIKTAPTADYYAFTHILFISLA